jgi:ureidoacrylate peracid hydrolase
MMSRPKYPKESWAINPDLTALVVVDMQRTFVEQGAPFECPGALDFVPRINQLAAACRKLNIPVIFLRAVRAADASAGLANDIRPVPPDAEMWPIDGKRGAELHPSLDVIDRDYIIPKIRYSALIPGSSRLEPLLRGLGRDSFIICGVATDVCVGATTIDGMMLGFKVFFVGDLTATFNKERYHAALEVYNTHYAKVMTFDEVMKELALCSSERPL